jgi:hypothetical protein
MMPNASENVRLAPMRRSWNPMVWLIAWAYRLTMGGVAAPVPVLSSGPPGSPSATSC